MGRLGVEWELGIGGPGGVVLLLHIITICLAWVAFSFEYRDLY